MGDKILFKPRGGGGSVLICDCFSFYGMRDVVYLNNQQTSTDDGFTIQHNL